MSEKMKIALLTLVSLNAMPGSTAALHIRITVRW